MDPREQFLSQIKKATSYIKEQVQIEPEIGLILGSGMAEVAENLFKGVSIDYRDIPNFPEATTAGHHGKLTIGHVEDVQIAAMQGRYHSYEGYTMWGITLPVRVLAHLGCRYIIVTNCAGSLVESVKVPSIMLIKDHINLMSANPITGPEIEELGSRFVDMNNAYDLNVRKSILNNIELIDVDIYEGVYAAVNGPNYETPSEIKYIRKIGADAVGMSTVPEVIVARQQGLKVIGISVITNNATNQQKLEHKEVLAVVGNIRAQLEQLLTKIIKQIGDKKE